MPPNESPTPSVWPILGERSERLELPIQVAFRKAVKELCVGVRVVAIPNAGKRGQKAVRQAKAEGMASGFPDTMVLWAHGDCPENRVPRVVYLEFKRGCATSGHVSENQAETLDWLRDHGFPCCVVRHEDAAIQFLRECGAPFARD